MRSKSVLRVAAEEVANSNPAVTYFPSYEIVMASQGRYFEENLRSVNEAGVDHVMRVFFRRYAAAAEGAPNPLAEASVRAQILGLMNVVCEEEELDRR
jgi:hypothetical protein